MRSFLYATIVWVVAIFVFTIDVVAVDPLPDSITVMTWNLEWFYDDFKPDNGSDLAKKQSAPSKADWEWKLNHVAEVISKVKPTILCLQEVESRSTLRKLVLKLREEHNTFYRIAFIEGLDFFTEQDVAILYQSGLVQYSRREQSKEMWDSKDYYNLQKHLLAKFEWGEGAAKETLSVINVHMRAGTDAVEFRKRQCRLAHEWMKEKILAGENVIITGDLNTDELYGEETANGDMALVRGLTTRDKQDDLLDLHEYIDKNRRTTHLGGKQFDRILASQSMLDDQSNRKDLVFSKATVRPDLVVRGKGVDQNHFDEYYKIDKRERDISDHYPVIAEFEFK